MKVAHALTLAADSLDLPRERLQAIGRAAAGIPRQTATRLEPPRAAPAIGRGEPVDLREGERRQTANARALQSCHVLLVRTIAMLA